MFVLILLGLVFLLSFYLLRTKSTWNGPPPPSPPSHPILGHIPTLARIDSRPQFAFHHVALQFGSLVRLKMGRQFMLLVSGFKELKELHENEGSANRADLATTSLYTGTSETRGILFNSGEEWKQLRKFTLKCFKDLGLGKNYSEEIIIEECRELNVKIEELIGENNGIVDLDKLFNKAALNIVWHFTAGERFDYDDEKMHKFHFFLDSLIRIGKDIIGKPLGVFPSLRFFPPFRTVFNSCSEGMSELRDFISATISEHKISLDPRNPRDYIDMVLINAGENPTLLTNENLMTCCMDLFAAGSETTSRSLMFALAFMIRHPEVAERVRRELEDVVGSKDLVRIADRENLPYTEATLNEVWRISNVVPVPPPRVTNKNLTIGQFEIPATTMVFGNSYTIHMDQTYWGDPDNFRPDRFISEQKFRPDERNIPFGIGKRRCLGENLARMENFLLFSNLMKHFTFNCVNGKLPDINPEGGFTYGPPPFSIFIKKID